MSGNNTPSRTSRIPGQFAHEGAVKQEGSLPLYQCNKCGHFVVWATSNKTGRKYLVSVSASSHDIGHYYMKHHFHSTETCEANVARRKEAN